MGIITLLKKILPKKPSCEHYMWGYRCYMYEALYPEIDLSAFGCDGEKKIACITNWR